MKLYQEGFRIIFSGVLCVLYPILWIMIHTNYFMTHEVLQVCIIRCYNHGVVKYT